MLLSIFFVYSYNVFTTPQYNVEEDLSCKGIFLDFVNASPTTPSKELQLIDVGKRRWKIVIVRLRSQRSYEAKSAELPYEQARQLSRRFSLTPTGQSLSMTKIASRKIAPAVHKIDSNSSIGNKESAHRITPVLG